MKWWERITLAGATLSPALLVALAAFGGAAVRYSAEPADLDQRKLDVKLNVLTLERRDESDEASTMECLNKRALKLTLPTATSFLIDELRSSGAYREVALSSGENWVRTGEIAVQGTISRLGQKYGSTYLGVIHWKVLIPSSKRLLWEGNTQGEAEKEGPLLHFYTSKVCGELLRQNFFQLRAQLAMVLPQELEYKDPRPRAKKAKHDDTDYLDATNEFQMR